MFNLYLENPFLKPNEKHVRELHDEKFLILLRDTCIKRLAGAMQAYFNDYNGEDSLEYLKEKTKSVRLIGGFLTKYVNSTSDIDITVILKDQTQSKDLQRYFRENINFKPLSDTYDYQVNYFSDISGEHIIKFKRYGIELLTNEIFDKSAEDIFLDKNMVVVEDVLSKKKLQQYFITPIIKCITIIQNEILKDLNVNESTCDKLKRIYPILDRVGTKTFPEFNKLPKALTIYEYTQDNLRYKALNEDGEIHKILVLAQSKNLDELNKYLIENSSLWKSKSFNLKNTLEPNLYKAFI